MVFQIIAEMIGLYESENLELVGIYVVIIIPSLGVLSIVYLIAFISFRKSLRGKQRELRARFRGFPSLLVGIIIIALRNYILSLFGIPGCVWLSYGILLVFYCILRFIGLLLNVNPLGSEQFPSEAPPVVVKPAVINHCKKCNGPIYEGNKFCANCGEVWSILKKDIQKNE